MQKWFSVGTRDRASLQKTKRQMSNFAQIIVFKKLGEFDQELTYLIPPPLISQSCIGCFVEVPFHQKNAFGLITGLVSALPEGLAPEKIKPLSSIVEGARLPSQSIELARFIADSYRTSLARSLRLFIPKQVWEGNWTPPALEQIELLLSEPEPKGEWQKKVLTALQEAGGKMTIADLKTTLTRWNPESMDSLIKKAYLKKTAESFFIPFDPNVFPLKKPAKRLSPDQEKALSAIQSSAKPVLLHGVTGSGKTELYLRCILPVIEQGKQVILLVPEIALTPQMTDYFKEYLGPHVALFHSQLTESERIREWWKVKTGFAPLAIGSRSAIFAPTDKLGLIILDEEHEWTYKQEASPYYETHRVAEEMAKRYGASLLFGSATPKAETYLKAKEGDYTYIHLPERFRQNVFPAIHVVDLREEFKKKNFSIFSLLLQNKIRENLEAHEQIILFVNQRGLSNAVVCRDCGYTEKCPKCEIAMKYHADGASPEGANDHSRLQGRVGFLLCHYCDFKKESPLLCPQCRSPHIRFIGVGTQRVEEEVRRLYPSARTLRADSDTVRAGAGFESVYRTFLEKKADILIGTQMVAKGLDFEKVNLIGIILADIGLHIPDFRSSERLFQLITQVAGRCGRGEKPGEVVLQTYSPHHPVIQKAASYAYRDFMEEELKIRSQAGYPPYTRMVKFTVVGSDLEKLTRHIQTEQEVLEDIFKIHALDVQIVSAPAFIPKIAGRYYYHVLLRSKNPSVAFRHWTPPKGWRIDVDPVHTV